MFATTPRIKLVLIRLHEAESAAPRPQPPFGVVAARFRCICKDHVHFPEHLGSVTHEGEGMGSAEGITFGKIRENGARGRASSLPRMALNECLG